MADRRPNRASALDKHRAMFNADHGRMLDDRVRCRAGNHRLIRDAVNGWLVGMNPTGRARLHRHRDLAINGWRHHRHAAGRGYDDITGDGPHDGRDTDLAHALLAVGADAALPPVTTRLRDDLAVHALDHRWLADVADGSRFDEMAAVNGAVGRWNVLHVNAAGSDLIAVQAIDDDRRCVDDFGVARSDDNRTGNGGMPVGRAHLLVAFSVSGAMAASLSCSCSQG